jgi:uncharacterized protein YmfQ (DUF2313 family)
MKFEDVEKILPINNYSERDYLKSLKYLLPKGDIWGFEIRNPDDSTVFYNDNVISTNKYKDTELSSGNVVYRDNIITSVSSRYASSRIGTFLSAIATEIKRFCDTVYDIFRENIPGSSSLFLSRWEKLTNEKPYPEDSILYRQERVHHKIDEDYKHSINNSYYVEMVKRWFDVDIKIIESSEVSGDAFYVADIAEPYPSHGVGSRVGDRLNDISILSIIYIEFLDTYTEDKINRVKEWVNIYKPSHIEFVYIGD